MNLFPTIIGILLLTTLVGCGDDLGSSNDDVEPKPESTTPTVETDQAIRSSIHRTRGNTVLSYIQEIQQRLAGTLSTTAYRVVPDMELDDEGTDGKNIVTRTSLGRPAVVCGINGTFANVTARINDCVEKNSDKATWSGTANGASGEGDWKLVAKLESGQELWLDDRTKMVWSDIMNLDGATTFNWCQAAGNDQSATETVAVDCNQTGNGISVCNNLVMDSIGGQIEWRLPTRNDFLQADLDGIRFALLGPNETGLWTATMKANVVNRTEAWVYFATGTLSTGALTSLRQVRCIGAPAL